MRTDGTEWVAQELRRLLDDILDRVDGWTIPLRDQLRDEAIAPIDRLLRELAVEDTFACLDERDRARVERALDEVRAAITEVIGEIAGGPPRSVGERLSALATDLQLGVER